MQSQTVPENSHNGTKYVQSQLEYESKTPPLSRNDSLVLSVTADKFQSPYQSDLLKDSYQYVNYNLTERTNAKDEKKQNDEVCGLTFLGQKIEILEGKVQSIKTQRVSTQSETGDNITAQFDNKENIRIKCNDGNRSDTKGGFFMKRNKGLEDRISNKQFEKMESSFIEAKTRKNSTRNHKEQRTCSSKQNSFSKHQANSQKSKHSHANHDLIKPSHFMYNHQSFSGTPKNSTTNNRSVLSENNRQLRTLQTKLSKLEQKAKKEQRSRSLCSVKLSQAKINLCKARAQSRKQGKQITQLQKKLNKSENIRKKQKQTIAKQKKQIDHLHKLIRQLHKELNH